MAGLRVLSVTSECVPLVKTGGLADVAGALPGALAPLGIEMRTLLPGYPKVMAALGKTTEVLAFPDLMGGKARVLSGEAAGLALYILDAPHLFDRAGTIYLDGSGRDWPDNPERFAALSWAGAELAAGRGRDRWKPDLLHGHDWQAGFAPYYLKRRFDAATPSIITIHNIAFHGLAPANRLEALRLDRADFTSDGFEYWGKIGALKAGLTFADKLTTVSPTYAAELMQPDFGMGLDGLLRQRRADLVGILNGIDTGVWDPATDPAIRRYKTPRGKAAAKRALRKEFRLPESDGPLCVVISRLTQQKGLDVLLQALPALVDRGGQLVLLGSGDAALEAGFRAAADHPHVAVHIGYDEAMSHRLIAGGDAILVPSRFEPCGLTQMYGLRYGTLPVVSYTGGLADTVINASPAAMAAGAATGLQFTPVTADALAGSLLRLVDLYRQPETWAKLVKNAMKAEVGWDRSALAYGDLYRTVVDRS